MNEFTISNHIVDIVENSIEAKASKVKIAILKKDNLLKIVIEDDGIGMDENLLNNCIFPSVTTKQNEKRGFGIPLFKQAAENSGGSFRIDSKIGIGTKIESIFIVDKTNVPFGELGDSIIAIMPSIEVELRCEFDDKKFETCTKNLVEEFGDIQRAETLFGVRNFINKKFKKLEDQKL